jgi:hypothetical protein
MSNIIIEPLKSILGLADSADLIVIMLLVMIIFSRRRKKRGRYDDRDL